jgi:hypothetical protein
MHLPTCTWYMVKEERLIYTILWQELDKSEKQQDVKAKKTFQKMFS